MGQVIVAFVRVVLLTFVCGSAEAAWETAEKGVDNMHPDCFTISEWTQHARIGHIETTVGYVHREDGKVLEVAEVYLPDINKHYFSAGEVELLMW